MLRPHGTGDGGIEDAPATSAVDDGVAVGDESANGAAVESAACWAAAAPTSPTSVTTACILQTATLRLRPMKDPHGQRARSRCSLGEGRRIASFGELRPPLHIFGYHH